MKKILLVMMLFIMMMMETSCSSELFTAKMPVSKVTTIASDYQTKTTDRNTVTTSEKGSPAETSHGTAATTGKADSAKTSEETTATTAAATGKADLAKTTEAIAATTVKADPARTSMATTETTTKNEPGITASSKTPTPAPASPGNKSIIADHTGINLDNIPAEWIEKAKKDLHIAYGHTSHGSQVTSGLLGLTSFKNSPYIYLKVPENDSLDLRDHPFTANMDLGQPKSNSWAAETRKYLENNKDINVVMWSWCGQLSTANDKYVKNYLDLMQALENDYPQVTFVYMTGHLNGTGETGILAKNNKQIRDFCINNNKVLYDFADIESYNPDGVYFGDKYANDACDYDSNGDKLPDANWAKEWQETHKEGVDWYQCPSAHSQPANANMKAYAAWYLFARIAGWEP